MYAIHIYHIYATTYAHVLSCFTCIQLLVTLWTVYGDSPGRNTGVGYRCPPAGDLPNLVTEPIFLMHSCIAGGFFTTSVTWEAHMSSSQTSLQLASKCNLNSAN